MEESIKDEFLFRPETQKVLDVFVWHWSLAISTKYAFLLRKCTLSLSDEFSLKNILRVFKEK